MSSRGSLAFVTGLLLALSGAGCDSWYTYRIGGAITRDSGDPAGCVAVVPSIGPLQMIGPPRSDSGSGGGVVTAMCVLSANEVAPILVEITSPDGRFEQKVLGELIRSAFSPPPSRLDEVYVYYWEDRWIEIRVPTSALSQPVVKKWTRSIELPTITLAPQAPSRVPATRATPQ